MLFVVDVIRTVLDWGLGGLYPTSTKERLWLQIIEGLVDDDVWLWVDGDEEWFPLRRRIALQRYPTVTGIHGKRNERVDNATPAQRVCAIAAWLIVSSKGVAELFAFHGRTPPMFRTPWIAETLRYIIRDFRDAFPSQTSVWENALVKSKEDGCICSPADCWGMREWFDMMVWLEGTPPTLDVGYKSCVRCRSILKSRLLFLLSSCHFRYGTRTTRSRSSYTSEPNSRVTDNQKTGTVDEETWIRCAISSVG
ncbi:hypothetical protein EDC04DRAFT_381090 [Pisolithus marmoratus]|nr:hypothetical protein EDC04DRAFT_381090 [Pisolithus marmoratus]